MAETTTKHTQDEISEAEAADIRQNEFPDLAKRIFLNTAGGAPMCRSAVRGALRVIEDMAVEGDRHFVKYLAAAARARRRIARYIGADSEEDIAFTVNASSSAAAAARMLKAAGIQRVYCPRYEFPTTTQALHHLGFEVVFIGDNDPKIQFSNPSEALDVAIEAAPPCNAPSALVASHVNYLTGARLDLSAAVEACKKRGMRCCINATQSFGALPIEVSGIDILFGTGLKWAQAGFGTGFLYIKRQLIERHGLPKLTGWTSVEHPENMDNRTHIPMPFAKSLDMGGGAPPFQCILALGGALEMRKAVGNGDIRKGVLRIEQRMIANATRLRRHLEAVELDLLTPQGAPQQSGIVSFFHKKAPELSDALEARGVYATLRRHPLCETGGVIRFGVPFFAFSSEIDRAAEITAEVAASLC